MIQQESMEFALQPELGAKSLCNQNRLQGKIASSGPRWKSGESLRSDSGALAGVLQWLATGGSNARVRFQAAIEAGVIKLMSVGRGTRRGRERVAVLTADIIHSSQYTGSDRRRVDRVLRESFEEMERSFPGSIHTPMAFRVTAGDEFQCVIKQVRNAFRMLTYFRAMAAISGLRPMLRFRASLGVGEIVLVKKKNPYEEDGSAFIRAREGLDQTGSSARWTKLITGSAELDRPIDVVLSLLDSMQQRWTLPQWEAIRWALLGLKREDIAKRLRVSVEGKRRRKPPTHQSVTKRLSAAGWQRFEQAAEYLSDCLEQSLDR